MKRSVGRPKSKNKKVLMAFRLRPEFVELIRKRSRRGLSQARIVEMGLALYEKEIEK